MISERSFSTGFQSFWTELLPLLTPNYIHFINETSKNHLIGQSVKIVNAVKISSHTRHPSIISEFAFYIAENAYLNKLTINDFIKDKNSLELLENAAIQKIKKMENNPKLNEEDLALNKYEKEESILIALNYDYFFSEFRNINLIEFHPDIKGAGIINNCKADISIDKNLVEVKTVNRNLLSSDIKQLLTYLALQYYSGNRRWKQGIFFNPRKSIYYKLSIDELLNKISGGKTSIQVFEDIISFAFDTSEPVDSMF